MSDISSRQINNNVPSDVAKRTYWGSEFAFEFGSDTVKMDPEEGAFPHLWARLKRVSGTVR